MHTRLKLYACCIVIASRLHASAKIGLPISVIAKGTCEINAETSPSLTLPSRRTGNVIEGIKNGCASGLAGGFVKTLLQPFDTIKTVQQYSTESMSFFQAGNNIIKRSGISGLYSGLGISLVGAMPSIGIYFGIYQYCLRKLSSSSLNLSPMARVALSAGTGNLVASIFRVPYEVIKQRLQAGIYPNTMTALSSIYADGGLLGFFGKNNIIMQLARDIPYAMVTLVVYEHLQEVARSRNAASSSSSTPSHLSTMVIGAVAGGIGTLATNPLDVIKTRMMTSPHLYANAFDAASKTMSNEGVRAFMRGSTPRLLHKIPANGLFFVAYEFFRVILMVRQ